MKKKKCKNELCKKAFIPDRPFQSVCSPACSLAYIKNKKDKKFKAETAKRKKHLRESDKSWWEEKAVKVCNAYIRARDKNDGCICCGAMTAMQWDAGHFRPSTHSFLRYHEDNIHKQRSRPCNKDQSGNLTAYEDRLRLKIGDEKVDWLKLNHPVKKWTIEELKEIIVSYKEKIKIYT